MAFTYRKTVKALNNSMELIAKSLQSRLEENNSIASGNLGSSIAVSAISKKAGSLDVNISMLDYWSTVNDGTDPHVIFPLDDIKKWLTYPNVKDKLGMNNSKVSEANSAAYLISRKIWDKGTDGNNFASDVFDSKKVTVDLPNAIADAVFEDLNIVFDDLVTSIN